MKLGIYLWIAFCIFITIPFKLLLVIAAITVVCGLMGRESIKRDEERARMSQQGDQTTTGA